MKKKIIALMMAVVICLGLNIPASAAGTCNDEHILFTAIGICNGDYVNIRTGPGLNYKSVGYAYKNDPYYWYQTARQPADASWIHVHGFSCKYEEHIGWMYSQYYTGTESPRMMLEIA